MVVLFLHHLRLKEPVRKFHTVWWQAVSAEVWTVKGYCLGYHFLSPFLDVDPVTSIFMVTSLAGKMT